VVAHDTAVPAPALSAQDHPIAPQDPQRYRGGCCMAVQVSQRWARSRPAAVISA